MANTNTNITPLLLAGGLRALRQFAVMPRLVNRSYSDEAAQKGDTINVPIPSALAARDVVPGPVMLTNVDYSPTKAQIPLTFWKESIFQLSDQDAMNVFDGVFPMQASEAVKSIANAIDTFIIAQSVGFYGAAGTAGTTPFNTSLTVAGTARKLLNKQLAPMDDRRGVLDPDAESNFLLNTNILNADQKGDQKGIITGSIGTILGLDWYMDQNVTTYTPGTGWVTGWALSTVAVASGDSTLNAINATASGSIKVGDIFTMGGSAQQYVVTACVAASATVQRTIAFYPPAATAQATAVALTVIATAYIQNLAFHRDALAWASRPLSTNGFGNNISSVVDPVSGIALRLEVSRQNKQTSYSFDVLGGAGCVRREYGVKILG